MRRGAGRGGRLRLPALLPARQRLPLPPPRPRGHARVDRQGRRDVRPARRGGRRPRRLPRRARGDPDRRPRADRGRARAAAGRRSSAEDWAVLQPNTDRPEEAEIAVSPTSRAGAVYILDTGRRHPGTHERARLRLRELAGVDLVTWLAGGGRRARPAHRRGPRRSRRRRGRGRAGRPRAPLPARRPAPGRARQPLGGERRPRGARGRHHPAAASSPSEYPDALARLWSALTSPHAGDILISAAEGYECVDWGGVSHAGGGSHGSLGARRLARPRCSSSAAGPKRPGKRPQWALRDLAPVILEHFGVNGGGLRDDPGPDRQADRPRAR